MHFNEYLKFTEISVFFIFSVSLFGSILSPYVKGLGFSDIQISLMFSVLPLSIILFSPVVGTLSDAIGRKKIILVGVGVEILAVFLYIYDQSWIFITSARVLDAFSATIVTLITLAKIEDSLDKKERGSYTGWSLSVRYLGNLIGPVVGAVTADVFFIKAPFIISAVLLFALFSFLLQVKEREKTTFRKKYLNPLTEIKEFLSHRKLKGMAITGMVMHASNPAIGVFLPLFIIQNLNLSISYVGYAYFLLTVTHLLQFKFGKLSDRYGAWRLVLIGCGISALGTGLITLSNGFLLLALILLFKGIENSMWNVSAWDLMSDVGEKFKEEGEILTSYMSLAKMGSFISFLLSGFVVTFLGIRALFLLNSAVIFVGMLLSYFFFRGEK